MTSTLVSEIIPTHNRRNVIGEEIGSVLSQGIEDIEVIVIADASTDNTQEVLRAIKDSRIQVCFSQRRSESLGTAILLPLKLSHLYGMVLSTSSVSAWHQNRQVRSNDGRPTPPK